MYLTEKQLRLMWRAFDSSNKEYPTEEEEQTATQISEKVKKELYNRFGIIVE